MPLLVLQNFIDLVYLNQSGKSLLVCLEVLFLESVDLALEIHLLKINVGLHFVQLCSQGFLQVVNKCLGQLQSVVSLNVLYHWASLHEVLPLLSLFVIEMLPEVLKLQ